MPDKSIRKALSGVLLCIGLVVGAAAESGPLIPRYHAVMIGIDDYSAGKEQAWPNLRSATRDASAIGKVLAKDFGFQVTELLDKKATRAGIFAAMESLTAHGPDDAVLVYFAGHGSYEEQLGEGYWIPADGDRENKAGWIANTTIETFIRACEARHVLLVSDSCYSGSLFRGAPVSSAEKEFWYQRILMNPSRYLFTSGNLEPVLAGPGKGHSVFAQEMLNVLKDPAQQIFSITELAQKIKPLVADLTGQMPRDGPMKMARHAGGEFVFLRNNHGLSVEVPPEVYNDLSLPDATAYRRPAMDQLKDYALLESRGARGASARVLEKLSKELPPGQPSRDIVQALMDPKPTRLDALVNELSEYQKFGENATDYADYARPRVVLMLEPGFKGAGLRDQGQALLFGKLLGIELKKSDAIKFVKRRNLEAMLSELKLGASNLSEERAKAQIGKILPAGIFLVGEVFEENGDEWLYFVLEDAETTIEFASFILKREPGKEPEQCRTLAGQILQKIYEHKPLEARVLMRDGEKLKAGIGSFHGALPEMTFSVVERTPVEIDHKRSYKEQVVGSARVVEIQENLSDFEATWKAEAPGAKVVLWLRESK